MTITREKALELAESHWWEFCDAKEIAAFQLKERLLCLPFDKFHEAIEKALGRSVWTHEFAQPDSLMAELGGEIAAPTMEQILAKLPAGKRILLVRPDQ